MSNEITKHIKDQIESLTNELSKCDNQKRILEINKLIDQNKNLLETTYNDLNKRAGITLREFEREVNSKPKSIIRATGIDVLDEIFGGGFQEGMFINLVGESGSGKSTLALEILLNISEYTPSVFFSFEMGDRTTLNKIHKIGIKDSHKDNLIIDRFSRNIENLKREVNLYANDKIKFFVIDSKMKLEVSGISEDYKKISYLSNEISKMCQQLGIIVILINQLSEEALKTGRVSLKGSGDQYYDSDIILVYKKHKKNQNMRELFIEKNRQTERTGISIETKLENNRTVQASSVVMTTFKSDNDFIGDIL